MVKDESALRTPHSALPKVLGLSGGIAGGKTTVARMLKSLGAAVINADEIAHETLNRPSARGRVVRRWGREMLAEDGALDRGRLAEAVFSDPRELRALEAITHPLILREIRARIRRHKADGSPLIVLDAPLLNEARLDRVCDAQVFVAAGTAQRTARAARERRWRRADLLRREAQQMALQQKRRRARYIIDNSGSRAATRAQVRQLWRTLLCP